MKCPLCKSDLDLEVFNLLAEAFEGEKKSNICPECKGNKQKFICKKWDIIPCDCKSPAEEQIEVELKSILGDGTTIEIGGKRYFLWDAQLIGKLTALDGRDFLPYNRLHRPIQDIKLIRKKE